MTYTALKASGVRRVIDTFVAYGLPEPEFEATQGGMAVTVFNAVNVGVNVGVNGLLSYIQSHPGQRAGDMAVAFKLTQRTIERWLKQLKEDGLIEFRGAPKTGGLLPQRPMSNTAASTPLLADVRLLIDGARQRVASVVNAELTQLYWRIAEVFPDAEIVNTLCSQLSWSHLRLRYKNNTLEFLSVWEEIYNPAFNSLEFEEIKKVAGLNRFTMSVKQWPMNTNGGGHA